jgi:hypothetical protein
MISNNEMIANRYGKWARARRIVKAIHGTLSKGGTVTITTQTHQWVYDKPKQAENFRATKTGAYMQRGKRWECIDYCAVRCYA